MAMSPAIISVPANSSVFRVGSLAREVPFRLSMKHSIQYLERAISYLLINYLLTQLYCTCVRTLTVINGNCLIILMRSHACAEFQTNITYHQQLLYLQQLSPSPKKKRRPRLKNNIKSVEGDGCLWRFMTNRQHPAAVLEYPPRVDVLHKSCVTLWAV